MPARNLPSMEHVATHPSLPVIPAPRPFTERRATFRRAEDRAVHEERVLLARALDILAGPDDARAQVAEVLALMARVAGARRAAVAFDRPTRRVLVAAAPGEDPADARALASWLDAVSARPTPARVAEAPGEVVVVRTRRGRAGIAKPARPSAPLSARFLRLDPEVTGLRVGMELADPDGAPDIAGRMPASTLRHLVAALAAASARAEGESERAFLQARERERERFVSMIAHELRTPLTGLGGYLDLLAAGAVADPDVAREFIERGQGIVERMGALVGDLLELSRIEAGSLRLDIEPFSIAEACERALQALVPIAASRGVRLATDLPPRIRTARADARRVEQIVTNLAGNACKFVAEGGLVEVEARIEGSIALVTVRDDGPGIDAADRERVFQPFARLERHDKVAGTGLGLPITRHLARAMGGEVVLASVEGSGSSFVLAVPATGDATREQVAAAARAEAEREELELEERAILRAMRAGTGLRARRSGAAPERPVGGPPTSRQVNAA